MQIGRVWRYNADEGVRYEKRMQSTVLLHLSVVQSVDGRRRNAVGDRHALRSSVTLSISIQEAFTQLRARSLEGD